LRALAGLIRAEELNASARRLEELARQGSPAEYSAQAVLAACAARQQQLTK
jgi:hypothetical protein